MTDKNKRDPREETKGSLRKISKRRWFYPALYLCVAALIMTGVLWYQLGGTENQADKKDNKSNVVFNENNKDAVPVNGAKEVFKWPVAQKDTVDVINPFYDVNGKEDVQEAALVNYDHSYTQNTGIDIAAKDDQAFDVTAAMSGKVVKAEKDDLLGQVVEIEHKDGVTTFYESLASIDVKPGQEVAQGDKIGKAGQSEYNKDAAVHLHFEIRKDGFPVDPITYFAQGISSLDDVAKTSSEPKQDMPKKDNGMKDNMNNKGNMDKMPMPKSKDKSKSDQSSSTDKGSNADVSSPDQSTTDDSGANN